MRYNGYNDKLDNYLSAFNNHIKFLNFNVFESKIVLP